METTRRYAAPLHRRGIMGIKLSGESIRLSPENGMPSYRFRANFAKIPLVGEAWGAFFQKK
jgi:hypothetical protein